MENLLTAGGYLIGATILILCKALFDFVIKQIRNKDIGGLFHKSMKQAVLINQELSSLRDKYEFNRTSLIDYHNGITSFQGVSFKNASMRNEMTDINTKSIIKDFQNIPCAILATMLIELENSPEGYSVTTDDMDNETAITYRMYGIKKAYNFKVGKNLTEGVVSLLLNEDNVNLTPEDIKDIKGHIQRIRLIRGKK